MNVKILQQARRYAKGQRLKKIRKRILTVLCAIVVFITTYMLILPAITLDNEVYCGIEEHTHSDSCYETVPALPGSAEIVCGVSGLVIHTHDELCYYGGELICPLDEAVEHIHSDGCYTCESVLVCTDGDEGHGHSDECFVTEVTLVCTEPELQIHTHEDGCYALQCVAEGCAHEGECTETESLPVCTKPELYRHVHTEECINESPATQESVTLVCQRQEHSHTLACRSNPEADLEDEEAWTGSFGNLKLTGRMSSDILALAKTQTDYAESEANYLVADDGATKLGYTRYGAWASTPYAEWNTLFVSFCAYYSNADVIPETDDPAVLVNTVLTENPDLYKTPDGFSPAPGDIAVFDLDSDTAPDRVGIVSEASPAKGTLTVIEGDDAGEVNYLTYSLDDTAVAAYLQLSDPELDYPTDAYSSDYGAGTVMYHSLDHIDYQYSSHRVTGSDGLNFMTLTYVLLPYDELDGWEPNLLDWSADAGANYVVAYCADRNTDVIDESAGVAGEVYVTRKIEESSYRNCASVLSGIVEHSYPFITAEEMRSELRAAYEKGEIQTDLSCCVESEFIAAVQWAVWDMTGLSDAQVGATGSKFPSYNAAALNPLSDAGHTNETTVNSHVMAIRDWLVTKRAAVRLNIADHKSIVTRNGDGSYDVITTVYLDRALEEKEVLNVLFESGGHSYEMTLAEAGVSSFDVTLSGLDERELLDAEVTLNASIEHMQVYVYDSDDFQDMISGQWSKDEYSLGFTVDVETTSVEVTKSWADGQPGAQSVEVQLFADGTEYGDPIVLSEENGWKHTWDELIKYSCDGVETDYTVRETPVPEYLSSIERREGGTVLKKTLTEVDSLESGGRYLITYEQTNAVIHENGGLDWAREINVSDPDTIPASAYWTASSVGGSGSYAYLRNEESGSYLGFNGSNITASGTPGAAYYLYNHFYFLSGNNNRYLTYLYDGRGYVTSDWDSALEVTFYKLTETEYQTADISYVITNTKTTEYISVGVKKQWTGKPDGIYPESVTVELLQNGTRYGVPVTLSEENGWSYVWEKLPLSLGGEVFEYSVSETAIEHYTSSVTETADGDMTLFTIVNGYDRQFTSLRLIKADMNDPDVHLTGAEFELYSVQDDPDENTVDVPLTNGVKGLLVQTVAVGPDGNVTVEALEAGFTYYLIEKRAPKGYNKLAEPIAFRVEKQEDGGAAVIPLDESKFFTLTKDEDGYNVLTVKNPRGYALPETGGEGIYRYTIGGTALMAAALILLFYKQNKRRKESADSS